MKQNFVIAILLIAIGAIAWGYHGVTYTTHEKVLEIGPIKAIQEKEHTVPIPPIVGTIAVCAGIAVLILGKER